MLKAQFLPFMFKLISDAPLSNRMQIKSTATNPASPSSKIKQMKRSAGTAASTDAVNSAQLIGNVHVSGHPVILTKINRMRRKETDSKLYRELMYEVGTFLAYEATSDLSLTEAKTAHGVSGPFQSQELKERIAIAPVLRSGLGLVDSMLTFTPTATIVHLGLFREKTTLQPVEYYSRLPSDNKFDICYILDPIIATGGTTAAAIDMIKDWGVSNIRIIACNASRAGLQYIQSIHPQVQIYVGAVDEELSERGEIIPGVGDAGDRLFNSVI